MIERSGATPPGSTGPSPRTFSSYEYLKLIEEKGQVGFWTWDFATGAQHWSAGMCRIFGLEIRSVQPSMESFIQLLHPEDRALQAEQLQDIVQHGVMPDREYRIIRPDGAQRWISCRGEVQLSREGRPERAFGIVSDVTALRQALRGAQRNEQRYRALAEATGSIVWAAAPDGAALNAPLWGSVTGQSYEELKGFGWLEAVHPEDRDRVAAAWRQAVDSGSSYDISYRIRCAAGEYRWVNARALPVRDENGTICEWLGVLLPFATAVPSASGSITGAQIRAARALLGWSESDLSDAARVSRSTVRRAEEFDGTPPVRPQNLQAIRTVLEEAGVEFTFPVEGKPGVQPK